MLETSRDEETLREHLRMQQFFHNFSTIAAIFPQFFHNCSNFSTRTSSFSSQTTMIAVFFAKTTMIAVFFAKTTMIAVFCQTLSEEATLTLRCQYKDTSFGSCFKISLRRVSCKKVFLYSDFIFSLQTILRNDQNVKQDTWWIFIALEVFK